MESCFPFSIYQVPVAVKFSSEAVKSSFAEDYLREYLNEYIDNMNIGYVASMKNWIKDNPMVLPRIDIEDNEPEQQDGLSLREIVKKKEVQIVGVGTAMSFILLVSGLKVWALLAESLAIAYGIYEHNNQQEKKRSINLQKEKINKKMKDEMKKAQKDAKKEMSEFKKFISKGNVVDMAVGVIIGGAFGKIVSSLVSDVIMPGVGLLVGGVNFTDLKITLKDAVMNGEEVVSPAVAINYGNFLQVTFDFIIIALCVFMLIKGINKMARKKKEIPKYGTVVLKGVEYYRTRIEDADGRRVALYARTPEELLETVEEAQRQIEDAVFRRTTPTVAEYCERWLTMQSARIRPTPTPS